MKCQECTEEADELVHLKVGRRTRKLCEECAERLMEDENIAAEAESAMQSMMEYKGR